MNDWIYAISNLLDQQTELEKTPQGLGDLEIDWCIISTMVRMGKSPDGPSFRPKPDEMHVICQVFSIESVGDFTKKRSNSPRNIGAFSTQTIHLKTRVRKPPTAKSYSKILCQATNCSFRCENVWVFGMFRPSICTDGTIDRRNQGAFRSWRRIPSLCRMASMESG